MLKTFIQEDVMSVRCNLKIIEKKNHSFFFSPDRTTDRGLNKQLPLNILRRGVITYYSMISILLSFFRCGENS